MRALPLTAALALLLGACSGDETGGGPSSPDQVAPTTAATGDSGETGDTGDSADATAATAAPGDAPERTAPAEDERGTATGPAQEGVVTSRDGAFQLERPAGWSDVTEEVPQEIELAIRQDTLTGDFFSNLVVASEEPIPDLEQAVEEAAADVAGEDGEHEMLEPVQVDGVPAYGYLVRRATDGSEVAQVQRWLERDDRTYVVTFSTAAGQEEEQAPVLEQILSGWTWTDEGGRAEDD